MSTGEKSDATTEAKNENGRNTNGGKREHRDNQSGSDGASMLLSLRIFGTIKGYNPSLSRLTSPNIQLS